MCGSDKPQLPHLFKVTTNIIKALDPMIRVFRTKFYIHKPGRINIAESLCRNPLEGNAYANVLSHDSLGCRDVKLRALLTMSCSMLSSKEMVADISKGAPKAPANEVHSGHECINEQLVVQKTIVLLIHRCRIVGYTHIQCFPIDFQGWFLMAL